MNNDDLDIIVGPVKSQVLGLTPQLRDMLAEHFAIPVKNARFQPKVQAGLWDGKIRFFSSTGWFPTGLLDQVTNLLSASGVQLNVADHEKMKLAIPRMKEIPRVVTMRDYQKPIIDMAIDKRRGIIKAAVNSGKTLIAMEIIRRLRIPTIYIVPTQELFKQFLENVAEFLPTIPVGEIKAKGTFEPALLTVCMVQSLVKQLDPRTGNPDVLEWIQNDVEMVIADEGHHFKGEKWGQVFTMAKRAMYKFVLSATPLHEDKKDRCRDMTLIGYTGSVFGEITTKELVTRGFSVDTEVRFISYDAMPGRLEDLDTGGFFLPDGLYERGICYYPPRAQAMYTVLGPHLKKQERVLVFVDRIEHGDFLARMGNSLELRPQFMHGELPMEERTRLLKRFTDGTNPLLIATVLKEGVNIPEIDIIVNACGMESPTKAKQQGGRILRTRKGKTQAIIYDFIDASHERLLQHSGGRRSAYASEGFRIKLVTTYRR